MVHIPGGAYKSVEDREARPIGAFWIDRTEVTVAAFRAYVAAGHDAPYRSDSKPTPLACTWEAADNDALPVNCIDWHQAEAYCLWAKKRLPTAQEWGWAAQGREELRRFPWGSEPPSCERAIVDQEREDDVQGCGREGPWPVGSRPIDASRDGVLDMAGNLAEFTLTGSSTQDRSPRLAIGASWGTRAWPDKPLPVSGAYVIRATYSGGVGVRCVKDVGPTPPCPRAGGP